MTETVASAVAKRETGASAQVAMYKAEFDKVLPSHLKAETFVRLSQGALRTNDKLRQVAERNPASLLSALLDCARWGLEPDGEQYALVPRGDEVSGERMYQGYIELMYRAGAVASVKAEVVYDKDSFDYSVEMDRPRHRPDWFGDRGKMIGVYAYAVMKDGSTSKVVVMSRAQIEDVRDKQAQGINRSDSPWKKWPDRMYLKTVLKQLAKFVPTSAEYRFEQLREQAEAARLGVIREATPAAPIVQHIPLDPPVDTATGEVLEAEGEWEDPRLTEPAGQSALGAALAKDPAG